MPVRRILVALATVSITAAQGCGDCVGVGIMDVRPHGDQLINIGAAFIAEQFLGGSCSGELHKRDVRWWTSDTLVVSVDSVAGIVRGLTPGAARVWFRTPGAPKDVRAAEGQVTVTVY